MHETLAALFTKTFGQPPTVVNRLTPDGSQRVYFRMSGSPRGSVIGAFGPDAEENRAFLSFTRTFRGLGLPVPEIFAANELKGVWIEEDLGDVTLFHALSSSRADTPGSFPPDMLEAYQRVVEVLPRFQVEGGRAIDFGVAYPRPEFDLQSMLWDLNYFKYHFLKLAHIAFNEQRLENDFHRLIQHLLEADTRHFLYRDFQSRNIMLRGREPWFLDYQGGRRGAPHYDIASLLYDAKADIPESVRSRLLETYMRALSELIPVDEESFVETYRSYVLIRIMQAMGAYGYRGFFERKPRFLESVPYAARNVARLLEAGMPIALPELERVFERIVEAWADRASPIEALPGLTLHLQSFSYRQGLPQDETGHGGGFVFDCRALPNPGRSPQYAGLTGLDGPVIEYLESMPETEAFWAHASALVDTHVSTFRQRGFSDLAVAFGCTGGQHRSVYFAERLARHVRERHPDVAIRFEHSERSRWPVRDPAPETTAQAPAPGLGARAEASDRIEPWKR